VKLARIFPERLGKLEGLFAGHKTGISRKVID
jgi:hypothetical protein